MVTHAINKFRRYQKGLTINDLFPQKEQGICSCGCGRKLEGRKRKWYDRECSSKALLCFRIIKGDTYTIRKELFLRDKGLCNLCKRYDAFWEADHIIPVLKGGGGCDISNFQTLCRECHRKKTTMLYCTPNCSNILTTCNNII